METVGIRELKAHLSRHLKRVRSGARLMVTERGRSIATIVRSKHQLTSPGFIGSLLKDWPTGAEAKPAGSLRPVPVSRGRTVSGAVLEDRG